MQSAETQKEKPIQNTRERFEKLKNNYINRKNYEWDM
jgi:hypothetical protein